MSLGVGDYNGVRREDILSLDADGSVAIWEISGTTIASSSILVNSAPPGTSDPADRTAPLSAAFCRTAM
jgi:hypothetical protein